MQDLLRASSPIYDTHDYGTNRNDTHDYGATFLL